MKSLFIMLLFVLIPIIFIMFLVIIIFYIRMIIIALGIDSLLKKYKVEVNQIAEKKGLVVWYDTGYRSIKTDVLKINFILEWANDDNNIDSNEKQNDKRLIEKYCKKDLNSVLSCII